MRDLIESIEELTEAFAETINVTGGDKLEMTRKSFRLLDQMMSTMRIGRSERKEYMNGSMPIPQSWVARLVREGGAKKVKKRAPSSKKAENSLPSAREAEKAIQGVYRKIEKDLEGGEKAEGHRCAFFQAQGEGGSCAPQGFQMDGWGQDVVHLED